MNAEGFPRDTDFPQLAIASDPAQMREVFRSHLRPLASQPIRIEDCLLWRFRYRPGTRCILQYTLHLVNPETGRERDQWVTGVIYGEQRRERGLRTFRDADPQQEIPKAFQTFEPLSFIPDLKMLVQVYPYDRRLPNLPSLLDGPPPELARLCLSAFGPGAWRAEAWQIEPIRYRAGLAAVVQYRVKARDAATGRSEEKRFYAKVYRDGEAGKQTFQMLQEWWEQCADGMNTRLEGNDHTFTVGRPIAYLNDQCVLLQEESRGISLEQLLLQGCDTEAAVRRIARAVAAFNQESIAAPPLHLLEDQVAGLQRARSLLQWACPPLQDDLEAIVGGVAAGLKQAPVRPIHRDLKADHFLLDGSHLALLDLDSLVAADPVLDPATLLAQFFSMPFRFPLSRDRMREVAQTFAEEYFARVPPAWRRQLPLQYAAASMQVALGFFRRQEPRWAVAVVAIVEEARASLAGGVW